MDWLKEILGEELYKQLEAAINGYNGKPENKEKQIKLADLGKGEYVSSEKYKSLETDKGSVAEQLKTAQGLIEEFKKGTSKDDGLQGKIGEYETKVSALEAENLKLKTESVLRVALSNADANPSDMDYLLFRAEQSGELKLGDDGKIKGQDDLISSLKTSYPSQFLKTPDGKKILEHKLEGGGNNDRADEPKTLAEALKQQYEEQTKTTNVN